jgi:uncharacterized protein (DUF433 family)
MARYRPKKTGKAFDLAGAGGPAPHEPTTKPKHQLSGSTERKRRPRGSTDRLLTLAEIALRYGSTVGKWTKLIQAGRLPGAEPSRKVRRSVVEAYVAQAVARALATDIAKPAQKPIVRPRIIVRDGVLFFVGTSVPLRQLWRAINAGSSAEEVRTAFPELPPGAVDALNRYAQLHPDVVENWEKMLPPAQAEPGEEDDDGEGFNSQLEDIIDAREELFRRLAQ